MTASTTATLLVLPNEVLVRVLWHLVHSVWRSGPYVPTQDIGMQRELFVLFDLCQVRRTCTRLRMLVECDYLWSVLRLPGMRNLREAAQKYDRVTLYGCVNMNNPHKNEICLRTLSQRRPDEVLTCMHPHMSRATLTTSVTQCPQHDGCITYRLKLPWGVSKPVDAIQLARHLEDLFNKWEIETMLTELYTSGVTELGVYQIRVNPKNLMPYAPNA